MTSSPTPETVAAGLSEGERDRVKRAYGNEMGGFGLIYDEQGNYREPALVEPIGINHPIFGSHYRLNDFGLAVRALLQGSPQ